MKNLFYPGLVGLALFEVLNVYFIMPMPGSQQMDSLDTAYFLHSYHFVPDNGHHVAAMTDHGGGLVAAVARDNLLGVQFHPEKSQSYGLALLAAFLNWKP